MKNKTTLWLIAGLVLLLLLVGTGLWLLDRSDRSTPQESQTLERTEDGAIILRLDDDSTGTDSGAQTPPPDAAAEEGDADGGAARPGADPSLPEQDTPLTPDYFADAAFVGDETVMALKRYDYDGLLTQAAFYQVDTVNSVGYVGHMKQDGPFGKVYIGLGGAELAYRVSDLRGSLSSAIDSMRELWPDCEIVLMGVSPVSKYRTDVSQAIRMDRLPEYNDMLRSLAIEKQVWYLEITSALVGEDGYLPSEVTEDGINYTPGHYEAWYDLLARRYTGEPE